MGKSISILKFYFVVFLIFPCFYLSVIQIPLISFKSFFSFSLIFFISPSLLLFPSLRSFHFVSYHFQLLFISFKQLNDNFYSTVSSTCIFNLKGNCFKHPPIHVIHPYMLCMCAYTFRCTLYFSTVFLKRICKN